MTTDDKMKKISSVNFHHSAQCQTIFLKIQQKSLMKIWRKNHTKRTEWASGKDEWEQTIKTLITPFINIRNCHSVAQKKTQTNKVPVICPILYNFHIFFSKFTKTKCLFNLI